MQNKDMVFPYPEHNHNVPYITTHLYFFSQEICSYIFLVDSILSDILKFLPFLYLSCHVELH